MLQDIEPHHLFNQFVPDATPDPLDLLMHFEHDALLVRPIEGAPTLPHVADAAPGTDLVRLFNIDDVVFWGCRSDACELVPAATGFEHVPLRRLRRELHASRTLYFAANTGYQLLRWYRHNRFCGRCGHPTQLAADERALDCPACGRRIYPKIQPAVIVGVTDGADRMIMTKYANRPIAYYALVAGFTEIGETLEETVEREVMEEVGLKVTNIRYYKSQPWGIASDLLAGFYCDVVGPTEIHRDPGELKEARWFERSEIMGQPDNISLTNEMMMTFHDGKEPR